MIVPNNQRQHHTLHVQKDVLPYAIVGGILESSSVRRGSEEEEEEAEEARPIRDAEVSAVLQQIVVPLDYEIIELICRGNASGCESHAEGLLALFPSI